MIVLVNGLAHPARAPIVSLHRASHHIGVFLILVRRRLLDCSFQVLQLANQLRGWSSCSTGAFALIVSAVIAVEH